MPTLAYDFKQAIDKKIIAPVNTKRKFVIFNSDFTVRNIRFLEITFDDATDNALFMPTVSPFKWITIFNCTFFLRQHVFVSLEGANMNITNCHLDLTNIRRLALFNALPQCEAYK
jgi:hypothetical protein